MYARLNLRKNMDLRAKWPQTGRGVRKSRVFTGRNLLAIAAGKFIFAEAYE